MLGADLPAIVGELVDCLHQGRSGAWSLAGLVKLAATTGATASNTPQARRQSERTRPFWM
jgi:hypothetical protein